MTLGSLSALAVLLVTSTAIQAQTFTTLVSFPANTLPASAPVQGPDGDFYQAADSILIFKITPTGALTTLNTGGAAGFPVALTLGSDGNFYGTALSGGTAFGQGAVFKMTPSGSVTILHSFNGPDGSFSGPIYYDGTTAAPLTLGSDGNFYGTTGGGGQAGNGTVFRITPAGTLTTLHYFSGTDGTNPVAGLTLGPDGNFYGTTNGGSSGDPGGTAFKITPTGTLTTLHYFSGADGLFPLARLALGPDGNFYGTTSTGINGELYGTVFKITPAGVFAVIKSFTGTDGDGIYPVAGLTLGPDGNFYGTTNGGLVTARQLSTLFKITPAGIFTTLHTFTGTDGKNPAAPLTLGTDGNFYGTTQLGGAHNSGTFFTLNIANNTLSVNPNGVVNAATFASPVAPGSIAAVFGSFAIGSPITSAILPLPTALSGLSMQFGTAPLAPLFFASQSQVNVQIPWELAGQTQTTVTATQNGQTSAIQTVALTMYAPAVFIVNSQTGQGAILDQNFQLIGPANPTTVGAYVQIYCTGLGPVTSPPATGSPALANPLSWTTITTTATIGGAPATVTFSGLVPGEVGLYQVNVQVPAAPAKGLSVPVTISAGGVTSNIVTIAVQ